MSAAFYDAKVSADAPSKEGYRKRLIQGPKRGALLVASAYRTVSESAVIVIAEVIPVAFMPCRKNSSILISKKSPISYLIGKS